MVQFETMDIINGLLLVLILLILSIYAQAYFNVWQSNTTGPPVIPFLGCSLIFCKDTAAIHNWLTKAIDNYASPVRVWLGPLAVYFIHEPEHIKVILSRCLSKGYGYDFAAEFIGNGLLTSPTHIWKNQKKAIMPYFKCRTFDKHVDAVAKYAINLLRDWEKYLHGNEFEINKAIEIFTFDANSEMVWGYRLSEKDAIFLRHLMKRGTDIITYRTMKFYLYPNFVFKRSQYGREQQQAIDEMQRIIDALLMAHPREQIASNSAKHESVYKTLSDTDYNEKEIVDHLKLLMIAGFDTLTAAINSVLYLLANNLHVQDKVHDEFYEIYQHKDPEIVPTRYQDIQRLQYLDCVVKESIRLISPIIFVSRRSDEDITIGKHSFVKGSQFIIPLHHMQRSGRYWPQPLDFIPERHYPGHPLGPNTASAYLPFGAGPRNCIASQHGLWTVKTIISMILRKYVVKTMEPKQVSEVQLTAGIVPAPTKPFKIYIERRMKRTSEKESV